MERIRPTHPLQRKENRRLDRVIGAATPRVRLATRVHRKKQTRPPPPLTWMMRETQSKGGDQN